MEANKNVTLNFKIPRELYDKIIKTAQENNISMAAMIRVIFSEYFKNKGK